MDKSFDDLFNEFFKSFSKFGEDKKTTKDFLDSILKKMNLGNDDLKNEFENHLGEPDEVKNYMDGDLYVQEKIWHTKEGSIIETIVSDDPNFYQEKTEAEVAPKSLEEQLEEAVNSENYEKAAELRDLINTPPKRRRGRPKKL